MKIKGILKRGITATLVLTMTATAFAGCGKGKKQDEDSILNEAAKGSKEYVYKQEDINLDGIDIGEGYTYGLSKVGDRFYTSLSYDSGSYKVISFKADGTDTKVIDLPGEHTSYYNFCFLEDGNFYAYKSVSEVADTMEGGNTDAAGSSSSSDDASTKASSGKDDAATKESSDKEDAATKESSDKEDAASKEESKEESKKDDDEAKKASSEDTADAASSEDSASLEDIEGFEGMSLGMEGEGKQYLVKFDADGNVINEYDLSKEQGEDEYFNIMSIIPYEGDKVIVSDTRGIETYSDSEGFKTILDTRSPDSEYADSSMELYVGSNGQIYTTVYGREGIEVHTFDPAKGEISPAIEAFHGQFEYSMSLFGGDGFDVYISEENAIYGFDAKKNEVVKLLDYLDSDLEVEYGLRTVVAVSDKEFLAIMPGIDGSSTLTRLTKVPADQVKDKKILTFGGNYFGGNVRTAVQRFNKNNDEYKIKIVDYSQYNSEDNYTEGEKRLDLDIVSGNVPDLMMFDADSNYLKYQEKGVLYNYKPLFEKDEDTKNIKFLPNALNAMTSDDKMYVLFNRFFVGTVCTRQRFVQGKNGLTYEECDNLIKQNDTTYETAFGLCDKETMLGEGILFAGDKYLDLANKKCSFDSEDFIKLLEFANKFPDKVNYEDYPNGMEELYSTNKSLFSMDGLMGFRDYMRIKKGSFNDDIAFVGIPNNEGSNDAIIMPLGIFAISSQTKYPEVAWDFLKQLWNTDEILKDDYGFPVTEEGFAECGKKAMERPYMMVDGKKEYYDDTVYVGNTEITLDPLSQEDVDFIKDYVLSVDKIYNYNTEIHNIITEEASAYFSGQKSAEEVAKIIQSRISILINEKG